MSHKSLQDDKENSRIYEYSMKTLGDAKNNLILWRSYEKKNLDRYY